MYVDMIAFVIVMFSPGGQLLHTFGQGKITSPSHCIQYKSYLFVSDRRDHCVKMFDRKGIFLNKFGTEGMGNKQFSDLGGLSIDQVGQLMVCDKLNHRVQLLDIPSGKFRTKFEIKGKECLGTPVSLGVLSDGRIVVSVMRNHCIQVLE